MSFDPDWLDDLQKVHDRRLPARSGHTSYASIEEAATGASTLEESLDGRWEYCYAPNLAQAPSIAQVFSTAQAPNLAQAPSEVNCPTVQWQHVQWQHITVPAAIQAQGFDRHRYVNVQYPWDGWEQLEPGQAPKLHNPVSTYRRRFTLSESDRQGKRLIIRFEGVESVFAVWLNGQWVGYSTDGYTPAEFDITSQAQTGENLLVVRVFMFSAHSWGEDQDFFRLSGIFRPVKLLKLPAGHITNVQVNTQVDYENHQATVHFEVHRHNATPGGEITDERACGQVEVLLLGQETPLYARLTDLDLPSIDAPQWVRGEPAEQTDQTEQNEAATGFVFHLDQARLWSAENPYLYTFALILRGQQGQIQQVIIQRVGLRDFAIRQTDHGPLMQLNGQRIVFKGVNRHDFYNGSRTVPDRVVTGDLEIIKQLNGNAVRTSHYPNGTHFYEECDRLGLYVIDEMNFESHGLWEALDILDLPPEQAYPGGRPDWLPTMVDRARSMLARDRNHPCVLIWSAGNESYCGPNFVKVRDFFHAHDTRPVHYEGTFPDPRYPQATDIYSGMYHKAADIAAHLATNRDKPAIQCEYAHAMGNSFGAVGKYLDLAYREPLFQGGFIWDFADQAVPTVAPDGTSFWGYGGDSGEAPHDGEFCGNGIVFADHTLTPKAQAVRALYAPLQVKVTLAGLEVENQYLFTDSSALRCVLTLAREGRPLSSATLETAVKPGQSATIALPAAFDLTNAQTVRQLVAQLGAGQTGSGQSAASALNGDGQVLGEFTVTACFYSRAATPWAPAGYEVACGQGVFIVEGSASHPQVRPALQPGMASVQKLAAAADQSALNDGECAAVKMAVRSQSRKGQNTPEGLRIVHGLHNIGVHGSRFSALFSNIFGGLVSYRYGPVGRTPDEGTQLLTAPPRPCFWHAPTSNESGMGAPVKEGAWLLASRYSRYRRLEKPQIRRGADGVCLTYRFTLPAVDAQALVTYRVNGEGQITITVEFAGPHGAALGPDLPDLPEFGMLLGTSPSLRTVRWYGEGPEECYLDRRQGAHLGIYEKAVTDFHTPYLKPQESGSRTGVRWAEVRDANGLGLRLTAAGQECGMEFSAQPWSPFEVENAAHNHQLPPSSHTWLRPALVRRGVGGDDSWGAPIHPEYCVPRDLPLRFTFTLQGID